MKESLSVFIVEDNEWFNKLIQHNLSRNPDLAITSFLNGKDFLNKLHLKPSIVTLDYKLPDTTGEDLLKRIKNESPETEVIMISEQDDIEVAVDVLKMGAYDYFVKSKDIGNRLINCINKIINNKELVNEIDTLKKEVQKKYNFQDTIIGNSSAIKNVFHLIEKSALTNITINLTGETGTGKEVVAKAIHYNSNRKNGNFVPVNMAAIPSDLLESELFGHEKGAFTGAITRRIGKFEEANNGTIFLDEIGDLDINFQAKLLRVLQEREIVRVGGNKVIPINCRVIVATHKNLQIEVQNGNFREDLFYRVFGLSIKLPPLRERGNDVIILAKHFINRFCTENKMPVKQLSAEASNKLIKHSWEGNVRELKSVIELAVVMTNTDTLEPENININAALSKPVEDYMNFNLSLREYNRKIVKVYMEKYNNNTKMVAERLDIGQTTVYRLLKEDSQS